MCVPGPGGPAGGERMVVLGVDVGEPRDPFGDLHPAFEPRHLRGRIVLPRCDLAQRAAGLVDLADLAAARQRAHDGEAPGIVVGEVLEHQSGRGMKAVAGATLT